MMMLDMTKITMKKSLLNLAASAQFRIFRRSTSSWRNFQVKFRNFSKSELFPLRYFHHIKVCIIFFPNMWGRSPWTWYIAYNISLAPFDNDWGWGSLKHKVILLAMISRKIPPRVPHSNKMNLLQQGIIK